MNGELKHPIQIVFHNMAASSAIEKNARTHAEKLDRYFDHIIRCHVVIELAHRHQHKGELYHVRIDLTVPDAELVVSRETDENHAHEDVYVAIRDSFEAMKHQLQTYASKRRGHVKHHEIKQLTGRIFEVAPLADYGYIETMDGRRIRFTSNSIVNYDFNKLEVGDAVRFVEVENHGEPSASTVYRE